MTGFSSQKFSRRTLIASPAMSQAIPESNVDGTFLRRNTSSFRALDWRPYFGNLKYGAILVDLTSRASHYWDESKTI